MKILADPTDLEVIVTCLEVSALSLTETENARFTKRQLFDGAKDLMPSMAERDMETVFRGMGQTFQAIDEDEWKLR